MEAVLRPAELIVVLLPLIGCVVPNPCDVDGDGQEAISCGGLDCNDSCPAEYWGSVLDGSELCDDATSECGLARGNADLSAAQFSFSGTLAGERVGQSLNCGADLDADGFPDVVAGVRGPVDGLEWNIHIINDIASRRSERRSLRVHGGGFASASSQLEAGDLDGDGAVDIVIAATQLHVVANGVTVLHGPFTDQWDAENVSAVYEESIGRFGADIALLEVDGGVGLAVGEPADEFGPQSDGRVHVMDWWGGGTVPLATANPQTVLGPAGSYLGGVVAGDLNGTAPDDLIVSFSSGVDSTPALGLISGTLTSGSLGDKLDGFVVGYSPVISSGELYYLDRDGRSVLRTVPPIEVLSEASVEVIIEASTDEVFFEVIPLDDDFTGSGAPDLLVRRFTGESSVVGLYDGADLAGGPLVSVPGHTACAAGDLNADGYTDFVVGDPLFDEGEREDVGRLVVFLGGRTE